MALTRSGTVFVWGCNTEGQLGLGDDAEETVYTPTRLDFGTLLERFWILAFGNSIPELVIGR